MQVKLLSNPPKGRCYSIDMLIISNRIVTLILSTVFLIMTFLNAKCYDLFDLLVVTGYVAHKAMSHTYFGGGKCSLVTWINHSIWTLLGLLSVSKPWGSHISELLFLKCTIRNGY